MFVCQISPARYSLVCERVTRASLTLLQRVISRELPIRWAVSRHRGGAFIQLRERRTSPLTIYKLIYVIASYRRQGPVAAATSAFRTRSQTQRDHPITFTLPSRDCSRFPNSAEHYREAPLRISRNDDFKVLYASCFAFYPVCQISLAITDLFKGPRDFPLLRLSYNPLVRFQAFG